MENNNNSVDFYSCLGKLSVKFAIMEQNCKYILNILISQNQTDELISVTLTEDLTLSKTIELTKKLNNIVSDFEEEINNIIDKINPIKADRNLFIHGLWQEPTLDKEINEYKIGCVKVKIKYTENAQHKMWQQGDFFVFSKNDISKRIHEVEAIIEMQTHLLERMKDYRF